MRLLETIEALTVTGIVAVFVLKYMFTEALSGVDLKSHLVYSLGCISSV